MFQSQKEMFEQIDGVSMRSPVGPCMADICTNWVLNQALNTANLHQPTILRRYVDDLFCIFNNEAQLNAFFNTLNAIHANIEFTKELEHKNQLAYLDVLLTKNNDSIETTVYRKPHSQDKTQLIIVHWTDKFGHFFNHTEKQPLLLPSNVVYCLNCSCIGCYIGQTRRNIKPRIEEHNPEAKFSYKTDVTKHLLDNPKQTP